MGVATVTLIGDDPAQVDAYLALGAVVVVAPDRPTLERWWTEIGPAGSPQPGPRPARRRGLDVDLVGHCVRWSGRPLDLTELEFRVLAALAADPGRARSYRELRRIAWGDGPDLGDDPFVVRALVQRMRRKLATTGVTSRIVPVRGFGLRLDEDRDAAPAR